MGYRRRARRVSSGLGPDLKRCPLVSHPHVPLEPLGTSFEFSVVRDARAEDRDFPRALRRFERLFAQPFDAVDVLLLDPLGLLPVVDVHAGQSGRDGEED